MSDNSGWIKLHRQLRNWKWYKVQDVKDTFIELLLTANCDDKKWQNIIVKRGQLVTSIKHLSEELGITEQRIRTSLKKLKSTNDITSYSTNKYTVITIVNYEKYQEKQIKPTNKLTNETTFNQQTTNKQLTTTKEYKNINYLINEYKEKIKGKNFSERIRIINQLQNSEIYLSFPQEEQNTIFTELMKLN